MTYVIDAVIAREGLLRAATDASLVALDEGYALLPVPRSRGGELGFRRLTADLAAAVATWSAAGPIAYVEAEYWAGAGEQRSVVWEAGEVVLGPLHQAEGAPAHEEGTVISRALRRTGVVAENRGRDAFAMVGLNRFRHTDDWERLVR